MSQEVVCHQEEQKGPVNDRRHYVMLRFRCLADECLSDLKVNTVWKNLSLFFSVVSWCPVSVASASSPRAVWLASLSLGLSRALQSSRDSIPALHSLWFWLPQPAYSEPANYVRQCVCVSLAWTQPNVLASCAGPGVSPPASQTLQMKPWERMDGVFINLHCLVF